MAKKVQANFRWEESFQTKVDDRAKREGLTHTAFVIKALERYMDEVVDIPAIHPTIQGDIQLSTQNAIQIDERIAKMLDNRIANIQQDLNDDLITFEAGLLKKVESLINDSGISQALNAIATDKTALSPEQKERVLNEVKAVANLVTDNPTVGTELTSKEMLQYVKANPKSKNPKRDIERGLRGAYPDQIWQTIAVGFWKRIS
jgi:hypothetical protein